MTPGPLYILWALFAHEVLLSAKTGMIQTSLFPSLSVTRLLVRARGALRIVMATLGSPNVTPLSLLVTKYTSPPGVYQSLRPFTRHLGRLCE